MKQSYKSNKKARTLLIALFTIVLVNTISVSAAEPKVTDQKFIMMQTSLNAMMVAIVDWAAHEIWGRVKLRQWPIATDLPFNNTLLSY